MRRDLLPSLLVTAAIVGLGSFAVIRQLTAGVPRVGERIVPLAIGDRLDPELVLTDVNDLPRRVGEWFGAKATVLYSWNTTCPCVPMCDERMRSVWERLGPEQGVRWIAVAGEPDETPQEIRRHMGRLRAFYAMLFDPAQRLCRRLGMDRAALIAIVDDEGVLRFRGNMDDDLKEPTRSFLAEALEAVLAGRDPVPAEPPPTYGCEFAAPPPDCPDDARAP